MATAVRTIGRYEVVRELGRGGMATVYLARQPDLDRHVALKELAAFHQSDPTFTRRFVHESRVVASLSHPNIVTVHEYFEDGGVPYIAMEYLERGSLRPRVRELTLAQTAGVLEGLLAGLAHAHARGIVHRDLKPENLMLSAEGRVKIADFGLAKALDAQATGAVLTATGAAVGTPLYMAPEQALAQEVGPATDLYSVGCIAYEMLCGRPPFPKGDSAMAILMRHVHEAPVAPRALNPRLDPRLGDWVGRLLVKDPAERPQRASEAWEELEEIAIAALGPRWRRKARIAGGPAAGDTPRPLTPAPFQSELAAPAGGRATAAEPPAGPPPREEAAAQAPPAAARRHAAAPPVAAPPVATPPAAAAPAAAPPAGGTSRAVRRTWPAAAAAALACAAAGWVLAPSGTAGGAAATTAAGDALSLRAPAGFARARRAPEVRLSEPVVLVGAADPRMVVSAGRADAAGPTLLPAELRGKVTAAPPPDLVRLGPYVALRYADLRRAGSERAYRVYAVPTSAGVATVVCGAPQTQLPAVSRTCERIAETLRLRAARPFPAGPSAAYAADVDRALATLRTDRAQAVGRMAAAATPAGQGAAARAAARAYHRAASAIGGLDANPFERPATGRVAGALAAAHRAYTRLADAAGGADGSAYAAASTAAVRAEAAVQHAVTAYGRLGYAVAR